MDTAPSTAEYYMTNTYHSIGRYIPNTLKIPNTQFHNRLMPYSYQTIAMVYIFHLYSSYNFKDELTNLMFDSNFPTQLSMPPPMVYVAAMNHLANQHKNLIGDAIISRVQYGLHFREYRLQLFF